RRGERGGAGGWAGGVGGVGEGAAAAAGGVECAPDHAGHRHSRGGPGVAADADRRWLAAALALIVGYMAAEVVVGVVARSLALISGAAHMLTDAASIVLALVAMRLAARPGRGRVRRRGGTQR